MPITVADVREMLRADAVGLALGALLTLAGSIAILSSAVVRRRMAAPLSLGIFAFLYGVRLLARTETVRVGVGGSSEVWEYLASTITYAIFIPGILFARAIEPSRRRLWNAALGGLILFAIAAIASDAFFQRPNSARTPNNIIAIVLILVLLAKFFAPGLQRTRELRLLQIGTLAVSLAALADNLRGMQAVAFPGPDLEPFGFTIATGCLAIIAARRLFAESQRLASLDRELSIARGIQYSILPQTTPQVAGVTVAARYQPMTSVAGDFYDFIEIDEHRMGVLVADVSGHGVPAALIASMVKVAFAAQQACADRPADVLAGMNRTLHGRLAGRYVTAAYLFIDAAQGFFRYSAAGHPPLLRAGGPEVEEIEKNGILLGFLEHADYEVHEQRLDPGDRLLIYTDGMFEAQNRAGDFYGIDRLKTTLAAARAVDPSTAVGSMLEAMTSWSGLPANDDLTLVLIDRNVPATVAR